MSITKVKWDSNDLAKWELQRSHIEGIGHDWSRVGASDMSVIMNQNQWKCPQRLYWHMCGFHSSFDMTARTVAGHLQEEGMAVRFEGWVPDNDKQSWVNALAKFKERRIQKANYFMLNSKFPSMFVSMDYIPKGIQYSPFTGFKYHRNTPIEMKHTTKDYYKNWKDGITAGYNIQVQSQLAVSGAEVAVFLVLVDGVHFHVREVERDTVLIQDLNEQSQIWTARVDLGKMLLTMYNESTDESERDDLMAKFEANSPEPNGMADNLELLQNVYQKTNGLEMIGDEDDQESMARYLYLTDLKNAAIEEQLSLRNGLTFKAKSFEYIKTPTHKFTNRRATQFKKAYFSITEIKQK